MLTDKDADGGYRIPHFIYSDAYLSETVAYADLVLPTRPISSAGTASRCWIGRSAVAEGPADAIRQPVLPPDRDVRPFQDVLIDLGARLNCPASSSRTAARGTRSYADYIVHHERRPGVGPLAGWRGADGKAAARRAQPEIS